MSEFPTSMNDTFRNSCNIPVDELASLQIAAVSEVAVKLEAVAVLLIYIVAFVLNVFIGAIILTTKSLRKQRPLVLALQLVSINVLQSLIWTPTVF